MRLFGKIDNQINRFDRAWLMWPPFDLNLHETSPGPYAFDAFGRFSLGVVATNIYIE